MVPSACCGAGWGYVRGMGVFKNIKKALMILGGVLIALFVFQIAEYKSFKTDIDDSVIEKGETTTALFKSEIENLLERVETEGAALGKLFGEKEFTEDEIKDLIRKTSLEFEEIRGVTACYEPYAFAKDTKLFCPYYNKSSGDYLMIEDSYDYTVKGPGTAWYTSVVEQGQKWVDPYYGSGAQEWFIDYGVPFYYSDGPKKGQVRGIIDFSLEVGDFKRLVQRLSVGKTGYTYISSANETFISHPDEGFIGLKNLEAMIAQSEFPNERLGFEAMRGGSAGHLSYWDAASEDEILFFHDQIETSGWGLGLAFFRNDLINAQKPTHRRFINMSLTLSLIFVIGLALYFGRDYLDRQEIEVLSLIAGVLLFANVFLVGALQHSLKAEIADNESPPIVANSALDAFIAQQNQRAETLKIDPPTPIPTGIYVERMDFEDSYNVNIGGLVWQKYPESLVDDVEVGFRFPQMSPFAEASFIEESYREVIAGKEGVEGYVLVGSEFRVTLRLNLEYKDYPFDKRHLDIRLSPMSRMDNILLVPDLAGYAATGRSKKSGISPDIKLTGNEIVETYFNFSIDDYATDFGFNRSGLKQHVPALHFNVHQKRLLINAFVTYLIPILVSLCLIYILILACRKTEERQGIIESMAAFFFVLIFSHIDLRKDIETADLIFMEYFYFATYLMIILSTFNLISYTKSQTSLFDFNDNQIYRAIYFPIFLTILFIVMLIKFY